MQISVGFLKIKDPRTKAKESKDAIEIEFAIAYPEVHLNGWTKQKRTIECF